MLMSKNLPVEWSKNLTIYEVNLRQYTKSGTIKEFETHLPRLQKLGVGILWFMPIQPIGVLERKGTHGSYYSIRDYFSVDPACGTLDEFAAMVEKIHQLGMYVILDWVANHTSWDNVLTQTHPYFYSCNEKGGFKPPNAEWTDVIELNYSVREMQEYMVEAMKFWIKEANIDGFRCDMANLVPTEFWRFARKELDSVKPVFMLAEAEQRELLDGAFDAIYNWNIFHALNRIAKGESTCWDLTSILEHEVYKFPANSYQLMFTSNHDENSWNGSELERLGAGLEAFTVFYFTLTGIPLIYSGQEAGNNKRLSFFEKDEIEWKEDKMGQLYTKLTNLKRSTEALWSGPYGGKLTLYDTRNGRHTLAYMREEGDSKVLVILNLSESEQFAHLHDISLKGVYSEIFSDDTYTIYDDYYFRLQPWEYIVLKGR